MPDFLKKHGAVAALLVVAGIALLIYLMRQKVTNAVSVSPGADQSPQYPNAQPIQLGDITIEGSPTNLTYNQGVNDGSTLGRPDLTAGDGGCGRCGCCSQCFVGRSEAAGVQANQQKIQPGFVTRSFDNLQSYVTKVAGGTGGYAAPIKVI